MGHQPDGTKQMDLSTQALKVFGGVDVTRVRAAPQRLLPASQHQFVGSVLSGSNRCK